MGRKTSSICALQNCTNLTNGLNEDSEDGNDGDYDIFYLETDIFPIVLSLFIVIINSLVLIMVAKRRSLRAIPTNIILASLALSDLLTGLLSIPLFIICNIIRQENICYAATLVLRFTSVSTVLHLVLATVDRYLVIIHALRYYSLVTKKRVYAAIAFVWSTAVFMSLIQATWMTPDTMGIDGNPPEHVKIKEIRYDIFCLVALFGLPLCFMAFTYGRIVLVVLQQRRNIQKNSVPGWQETRKRNRREWKAVTIFAIMLLLYVVCWLPYFILRLQHNIGSQLFELPHVVEYVLVYLRFATSLLNPCLYIFGKQDFRMTLELCTKTKRRGASNSEGTRRSMKTTNL